MLMTLEVSKVDIRLQIGQTINVRIEPAQVVTMLRMIDVFAIRLLKRCLL
jgi:hypothetical protein